MSRTKMAVSLVLLPAILSSLWSLSESTSPISQIDTQTSCGNHHLIRDLQEANLKVARLESILEETIQDLNAKSLYLRENEKLIEEMTHEINHLQSALFKLKGDSSCVDERLNVLEDEVRLLWAASRKNNFELHNLESKAQDAENRLEMVTSQVEKMADIVTEQWIQIQHLEQALQIAEMRALKGRKQASSTRCTFLKFIKIHFGSHLQKLREMLDSFLFEKESALGSYTSQALHQLAKILSAAKKYHHEGFIKQEMERNEFTAALANSEVIFFVASALITFPIMSAWIESQFFSKVNTNNNNVKETEVPNKEEPFTKKEQEQEQEQVPSFIPETQNGYGLYGHESGQLPPTTTTPTLTTNGKPYTTTTTTTNLPYKTESEVPSNNYYNPQGMTTTKFMDKGYTTNTPTTTGNNYYNGGNTYNNQQQGFGESEFMDKGYTTPINSNNYYNGGNTYNNQQQGFGESKFMDKGYTTPINSNNYYNGGNNYNNQKQGMSDTRFLENGRYYYDLNRENNYGNEYQNSKGVNYNNRGKYYGNNENSYEGYQNQDEFQESEDDFMP
ncbi:hypothetical protein F0562_014002 [Nyssa sinensis]|uniref:Uncharacterized protein n=1 Tax=Nyssa sinensis TaxID=561372 RepID=A0A5J4ZPS3_9ASTE|nr:hypothetical protein F0562_014002 [Nyssa sinensis]